MHVVFEHSWYVNEAVAIGYKMLIFEQDVLVETSGELRIDGELEFDPRGSDAKLLLKAAALTGRGRVEATSAEVRVSVSEAPITGSTKWGAFRGRFVTDGGIVKVTEPVSASGSATRVKVIVDGSKSVNNRTLPDDASSLVLLNGAHYKIQSRSSSAAIINEVTGDGTGILEVEGWSKINIFVLGNWRMCKKSTQNFDPPIVLKILLILVFSDHLLRTFSVHRLDTFSCACVSDKGACLVSH